MPDAEYYGMFTLSSQRAFRCLLGGALLALASSSGAVLYSVTPVTGANAQAYGLSNNGQVAGFTLGGDGVLYSGGTFLNIGRLSGGNNTQGLAVNDAGVVVGYEQRFGGQSAVRYSGGVWTDLSPSVGADSQAHDINNAGVVVGQAGGQAWILNGVLLTTITTMSTAWANNDAGEIAGWRNASGQDMAVVRSAAGVQTDVGNAGLGFSRAHAISEAGTYVAGDLGAQAFFYSPGTGTFQVGTLGGTSSTGRGINSSGVMVGVSTLANGNSRGFVYDQTNGMRNLNSLIDPLAGITIQGAYAINDNGLIAAYGIGPGSGAVQGFLLTPSSVPEPSTFALAGLALAAAVSRRRR